MSGWARLILIGQPLPPVIVSLSLILYRIKLFPAFGKLSARAITEFINCKFLIEVEYFKVSCGAHRL